MSYLEEIERLADLTAQVEGGIEGAIRQRDEARSIARRCFAHWSYADQQQMADDLPDWVKEPPKQEEGI